MQRIENPADNVNEVLPLGPASTTLSLADDLHTQEQRATQLNADIQAHHDNHEDLMRQRETAKSQLNGFTKEIKKSNRQAKWLREHNQQSKTELTEKIANLAKEIATEQAIIENLQAELAETNTIINYIKALIAVRKTLVIDDSHSTATNEYHDFLAALNALNKTHTTPAEDLVLATGAELARCYQYDHSTNGKKILTCAKQVLLDNSVENRNALIDAIEESAVRKNRKALACLAAVTLFLGAALIAAGIALVVTGVGALIGGALIAAGASLLVVAIPTAVTAFRNDDQEKASKAFANHTFEAAGSKAHIGFFSARKDKITAEIQAEQTTTLPLTL